MQAARAAPGGLRPATDPAELRAAIEERLAAVTPAWRLEDIRTFDGCVVALTCAATRRGRPVVLKLNPRGHSDNAQLAAEGDALAFWRTTGAAVDLLDRRDEGFTLLLERLQSSDTLEDGGLEDRLAEIGRLVARLHGAGSPPPGSLIDVRDFEPDQDIPEGGEEVLTHLDLHAGNVLRAGGAGRPSIPMALGPTATPTSGADRSPHDGGLPARSRMRRGHRRALAGRLCGAPPRWTQGGPGSGRASARARRRERCTTPAGRPPSAAWPTPLADAARR